MKSIWCLVLTALVAATGCGTGTGNNQNNFQQQPQQTKVTIYPSTAITPIGTLQPFTAIVGGPYSPVKWTTSAGTIDQSGNYTAPLAVPTGGTAKVTATTTAQPIVSGSATVTITTQPVTISISPSTATVKAGFSATYMATVGGTTNTTANWLVTDSPGDTTYPGFINGGVYTAPAPVLTPDTFIVLATSVADPNKTASAMVSVIPLENQIEQSFPIKLGTSGINANVGDCCSGTLGSLLVDQKGMQYILSNNHVIGRVGHAKAGEAIVQPGYVDTFCDTTLPHTVANLTYVPPILTSNVDAAIAQVVPGAVDSQGEIIGLGGIAADDSYIPAPPANSTVAASIGMPVAKSGRTTGLSCSSVLAFGVRVCIDYLAECGNTTTMNVCFSGQVIMGNLVQPGDSGSLIVDAKTAQPMGLVAGSNGEFTTANPVSDILNALKTGTGSTFNFVGAGQHPVTCPSVGALSKEEAIARSAAIPAQEIAHAIKTQKRYEKAIMQQSGVLGIGIGNSEVSPGHAALLIFVERGKVPPHIPSSLDGIAVRVIATGRFRAAMSTPNRTSLHAIRACESVKLEN